MAVEAGANALTWWAIASAFGGSIIGGTISTIVAFVVQKRTLAAAKKQRDDDRFEVRKALAFSLFIKMAEITSNFNTIRKYISESIEEAVSEGASGDYWRFVRGTANIFEKVAFKPEELAVLLSVDSGLFNKLMRWDGIHNGMLDSFDFYRTRRTTLLDGLAAEMTEGDFGTAILDQQQAAMAAPRMAELDALLEQLREQTEQDTRTTWPLFEKLFECFKREFKLEYTIGPNPLVQMPATAAPPSSNA